MNLLLSILISPVINAQQTDSAFISRPPKPAELDDLACTYFKGLNKQQRKAIYPFGKATSIFVVSYDAKPVKIDDGYIMQGELPKKNGVVDLKKMDEIKRLSLNAVDSLTDIFYNNRYAKPSTLVSMSMCFIPRNAVLFTDIKGRVFDYIEICFECQDLRSSSTRVNTGDDCPEKIDLLYNFFVSQGITIGTKRWKGKEQSE